MSWGPRSQRGTSFRVHPHPFLEVALWNVLLPLSLDLDQSHGVRCGFLTCAVTSGLRTSWIWGHFVLGTYNRLSFGLTPPREIGATRGSAGPRLQLESSTRPAGPCPPPLSYPTSGLASLCLFPRREKHPWGGHRAQAAAAPPSLTLVDADQNPYQEGLVGQRPPLRRDGVRAGDHAQGPTALPVTLTSQARARLNPEHLLL